ncbi:ankyrin 3 [Fusarium napiforme]|uniref:Ankyrin 3 n=1 Tax=Fusarium napiforme TaxID=42672 RepID=A0A8H5KA53_9HYPO|nr:ankyrin 3 [Fusarium napiforme]
MNLGNSEPRQVAGESSLQTSRRANKRRRHDQNGGVDERDGQKWPIGKVEIRSFECPFCKLDPHRYAECRGYRLSRLSDVMQHISRQHRILEVTLGSNETIQEEDIILYCTRCRYLFHGMGASNRRDIHMNLEMECRPANIEQTGVMLYGEFEALKTKLRSYPRHDETFRWNIIWNWCFPGKPCPPSPYVEIIVPRAEVQEIIQDELESVPGLSQQEAQLRARQLANRIHSTASKPRSSTSIPPQAHSNIMQTTPVPDYQITSSASSNPTLTSRPLQQRTQGVRYNSSLPYLGVHGTPTRGQRHNSIDWNNTLINNSAPSRVSDLGTHTTSGNDFVHSGDFTDNGSGYPPFPYLQYPTDFFESGNQDDDYLNTHGNTTSRRG